MAHSLCLRFQALQNHVSVENEGRIEDLQVGESQISKDMDIKNVNNALVLHK